MRSKKHTLIVLTLMFSTLTLFGCDSNNTTGDNNTTPATTSEQPAQPASQVAYNNAGQSYSVQFSDQWIQDLDCDADAINLDYADLDASVKIQRYERDVMELQKVTNLDEFIALHQKASVSVLLTMAESKTEPALDTTAMTFVKGAKALEITYKQGETKAKSYLAYLQTENAYYSFVITAPETTYNKFITNWSPIVTSMTELTAE